MPTLSVSGALAGPPEHHRSGRSAWLRAAVLGANDGLLSTGALLLGVAGAGADRTDLFVAGIAGLVAGACSMAIGEYVSVSSERDALRADTAIERRELAADFDGELDELRQIYLARGVSEPTAQAVASELMAADPLDAHLRDEHGITETRRPKPVVAAASSFIAFCLGAAVPLGVAASATTLVAIWLTAATLAGLVALGATAAWLGGAPVWRGALRVGLGGSIALVLTYAIGELVGAAV